MRKIIPFGVKASIAMLVLCLIACARSVLHESSDDLVFAQGSVTWTLTSVPGVIGIGKNLHWGGGSGIFYRDYNMASIQWHWVAIGERYFGGSGITICGLGFWYDKSLTDWTGAIQIPYWLLAAACSVSPITWLRKQKQGNRSTQLCPTCGYDLQQSPERCPECGTPITPPEQQTVGPAPNQVLVLIVELIDDYQRRVAAAMKAAEAKFKTHDLRGALESGKVPREWVLSGRQKTTFVYNGMHCQVAGTDAAFDFELKRKRPL